jgi:FMN-dependent NADH-azoreductase
MSKLTTQSPAETTAKAPVLLQINTSLFAENGNSSRLVDHYVTTWREKHPTGRVVVRDLTRNPIPHLDAERVVALNTPAEQRSEAQRAVVAQSDELIDELKSADAIVLGLPMYNFGVPSQLKAWIDHIARAGVTFRYTATGPVGLLDDRKLTVIAARGGLHRGQPSDLQTGFISTFFGFIGIRSVEFVYAEGLNISADLKARAFETAEHEIERLAA